MLNIATLSRPTDGLSVLFQVLDGEFQTREQLLQAVGSSLQTAAADEVDYQHDTSLGLAPSDDGVTVVLQEVEGSEQLPLFSDGVPAAPIGETMSSSTPTSGSVFSSLGTLPLTNSGVSLGRLDNMLWEVGAGMTQTIGSLPLNIVWGTETTGIDTPGRTGRLNIIWPLEFSWRNGVLLFDGDTMELGLPGSSSSNASVASSMEVYLGNEAGTGTRSSHGPKTGLSLSRDNTAVPDEELLAMMQVLTLHFMTDRHLTDGNDRPSGSTNGCRQITGPGPLRRTLPKPTEGSGSSKRRKVDGGSGEEGSGDDDERRDGPDLVTLPDSSNLGLKSFACPFVRRWRADNFHTCLVRLKTVAHVRSHLRERHTTDYCPWCYATFDCQALLLQHPIATCPRGPPPYRRQFMTHEELQSISEITRPRYSTPEEQWHCIYRKLFPDDDSRPEPYLCGQDLENMKQVTRFIHTHGVEIARHNWDAIFSSPLDPHDTGRAWRQIEHILEEWIPWSMNHDFRHLPGYPRNPGPHSQRFSHDANPMAPLMSLFDVDTTNTPPQHNGDGELDALYPTVEVSGTEHAGSDVPTAHPGYPSNMVPQFAVSDLHLVGGIDTEYHNLVPTEYPVEADLG